MDDIADRYGLKFNMVRNDWRRPTASRLAGVARVSEEHDYWVRGTMIEDPAVVYELSFEGARPGLTLPNTQAVYLGMWSNRRTLFEFELGRLIVTPDISTYGRLVSPLITRLIDYDPIRVVDDTRRRS